MIGLLSLVGGWLGSGPPSKAIVCTVLPSTEAVGFPTLTKAGAPFQQLRVLINGVSFPVLVQSCSITQNSNSRGQATVTVQQHGRLPCGSTVAITRPVVGSPILITENYRKEFAGFLEKLTEKVIPSDGDEYEFVLSCVDLASICDRRVVSRTYADGAARDIILDIVSNYLSGEGISTVNVVGSGWITGGAQFAFKSVTEAFNYISRITGEQWWIDPNRDLHFVLPGHGPAAPISFTDSFAEFQDMSIETTNVTATEIILRTNSNLG